MRILILEQRRLIIIIPYIQFIDVYYYFFIYFFNTIGEGMRGPGGATPNVHLTRSISQRVGLLSLCVETVAGLDQLIFIFLWGGGDSSIQKKKRQLTLFPSPGVAQSITNPQK